MEAAARAREEQFGEAAESDGEANAGADEPLTEEAVENARRFVEKERRRRALPDLPYAVKRAPGVAPIGAGSDFLGAVARAFGTGPSDLPQQRRGQPSTDLRGAAGGPDPGLTAYEKRVLSESGNVGARLVRAWEREFAGVRDQHGTAWIAALTQPLVLVLGGHDGSTQTIEWLGKLGERLGRYIGVTQQKYADNLPAVEPGLRVLEAFARGEHGTLVRAVAAHHCDEATSAAMVSAVAAARVFLELADWRAPGGGVAAVKSAAEIAKEAAASKAVRRILRPPAPFPVLPSKKPQPKEKRSEEHRAPAARTEPKERRPHAQSAPKTQR